MADKLRLAVLGAGHIGKIHAQKYAQHPATELVAVIDTEEESARSLASQYQARAYADLRAPELELDAVSIATPASTHYACATACLQRGWHCFIEKPICTETGAAQDLIKLAAERNLILQVGHSERHNPVVKLLLAAQIQPRFISCERLGGFGPRALDTDVILDLMIHDLDIILNLMPGAVANIQAKGMRALSANTDLCTCSLAHTDGAITQATASRVSRTPQRHLRLITEGLYLSADLKHCRLEFDCMPAYRERLPAELAQSLGAPAQEIYHGKVQLPPGDPIGEKLASFIARIGARAVPDYEDALAAVRALQLALRIRDISASSAAFGPAP